MRVGMGVGMGRNGKEWEGNGKGKGRDKGRGPEGTTYFVRMFVFCSYFVRILFVNFRVTNFITMALRTVTSRVQMRYN